ncbi:MAG: UDP-N-acetylmuramoyl-L-alanine--D-glutamate ligase [Candidatus Atelocyanobacterium thalassa]
MAIAYIIGLGKSGIAAARCLKQEGWKIIISDSKTSSELEDLQKKLRLEDITVKLLYEPTFQTSFLPELIIVSPGVPWDTSFLVEARLRKMTIIGELELSWRYLSSLPWLTITGTNGKTTTTRLIEAIFEQSLFSAVACGNIGYAASELALSKIKNQNIFKYDWIITEVSSYQCESSQTIRPTVGIWTSFTPDHLSRHKNLDNYYSIKASLLKNCKYQILNNDDYYLKKKSSYSWPNAYWTTVKGKENLPCDPLKGVYIEDGWIVAFKELMFPISLFKVPGLHNRQNLLMAIAAARIAGIDKKIISLAVENFNGVSHRLEPVITIDNIQFINDSKATNYDAAAMGLESVNAPVILIAGGKLKEGDDSKWIKLIKSKVSQVLLIGESAYVIAKRLQNANYYDYEVVQEIDIAVKRSFVLCKKLSCKVVLLSPACASFDQYKDFEDRGNHFKSLCKNLVS